MAVDLSSVFAFVRTILDGGWRLGMLFFIAGGLFWVAGAADSPPGVFEQWVPWAATSTLVGLSVILAAVISWTVKQAGEHRQSRIQAKRDENDALANLSTLIPAEEGRLLMALEMPSRFEFRYNNPRGLRFDDDTRGLIDKKIFRRVGHTANGVLCEVHPIIAAKKDELFKRLEDEEHLAKLEAAGFLDIAASGCAAKRR